MTSFGRYDVDIHFHIKSLRIGAHFRFDDVDGRGCHQAGDLRVRIPKVAEGYGFRGTGLDAGRELLVVHPALAEVAFLDDVVPGADKPHVVGAGGHTVPAADAAVGVDHDDPVFGPLVGGFDGTDGAADGAFAVVADNRQKGLAHIGITSFFDLFDPGAVASQGDFVLSLAGDGAGVAADTTAQIDQHSPTFLLHDDLPPDL